MRIKLLLVLTFVLALTIPAFAQDGPPAPELDGEIVVEGLNGPLGLYLDAEGNLWVVDSGLGGDEEIESVNPTTFEVEAAYYGETGQVLMVSPDGEQTVVAILPSVAVGEDVVGGARIVEVDGSVYVTTGIWHQNGGDEPNLPFQGQVVTIEDGALVTVGDLWAHEAANNPDETTNVETHPFGLTAGPEGYLYATDAAANDLLSINIETGEVATVATFEPLQGVFSSPWRDGELLADPVPTAVVYNKGISYVSLLSGAPFIPGSAKVLMVDEEGTVSDYALGLTMVTDLELGPDGNLYATQFGMFTEQGPVPNSGSVIRIWEDGTHEVVIAGLPFAAALAIDADGNGYVAINGVAIPGAGMVVYYEGLTDMEGMSMDDMGDEEMDDDEMSEEE